MNNQHIPDFFQSFRNLTVLVIGDVMLDSYVLGHVRGKSPEAPIPVVDIDKKEYRMGGAANVALNIKALGATPLLCTILGKDDAGDRLIYCLKKNNIFQEGILVDTNRSTTVKTRVIADQKHIVRLDEDSNFDSDIENTSQLLDKIEKLLSRCDVVVFEDYDKGVITPALIDRVIMLAKKSKIPVVVDPKTKNLLAYKEVTLVKPNLNELQEGLNLTIEKKNISQLEKAVKILRAQLNAHILVTLSENGVFLHHGNEKIHLPAHKRNIVDVSGAGDTVTAIAALCLASGLEPRPMAALSNLGGGLVCQYSGVVPIDANELWNEIVKMPECPFAH